jgi:hypothetical protein
MKKHRFNIFPEAKAEDYSRLRDDIIENGFDESQPVTIYEGEILDGWNRQKACNEIGIKPTYTTFRGAHGEAIAFVMRTNKRRNLNSGQWATVAADAEDLMQVIRDQVEREKADKNAEAAKAQHAGSDKNLSNPPSSHHETATAHKAAEIFNTNRTYVNQAVKMKQTQR